MPGRIIYVKTAARLCKDEQAAISNEKGVLSSEFRGNVSYLQNFRDCCKNSLPGDLHHGEGLPFYLQQVVG